MPVDLDEDPTKTTDPATTTPDETPERDGGTSEPSPEPLDTPEETAPDPMTEGLEDLDDAPQAPTPETDALPQGLTKDPEGRWRNQDGTFAAKQPSEEAAKSARAEIARTKQLADYKAKGLDQNGNKPWSPNLYGKIESILPGALDRPGHGIFVPESQRGALTALVARGSKWSEVQATRQQMAQERERNDARTLFYAEKFNEILSTTLLDPDWMERATKDAFTYQTAKEQVETKLRAAMVDAKAQFGPVRERQPEGTAPTVEPLDPYDGRGAVDEFLDDLSKTPEFNGLDKEQVIAILTKENAEIFRHHADHGWLLDERPIRLVAQNVMLSKRRERTTAIPAIDPATNRNKAAVSGTPPAPKAIVKPRPKATPTPVDPKQDPRYQDEPWQNPALDFEERRAAYRKFMHLPG